MFGRSRVVLLTVLAVSLLGAAQASATITTTHITTPSASPTYMTYTGDNPNTFLIKGTTDSTAPATDKVDILCFYGTNNQHSTLASTATAVSLASDGTFSLPAANVATVSDSECRLRAVPTGTTTNSSAFAGPLLLTSEYETSKISGGPNDKMPYDFYAWGQQLGAADDYASLGRYGLSDSYLFDSSYGQATNVFYGNALLAPRNLDGASDTRSEIQVDGNNAYTPYAARGLFGAGTNCPTTTTCNRSQDNSGFPMLTSSFTQDPATSNVAIHESEGIVRCTTTTYPPATQADCPSFSDTGVKFTRTITQTSTGHVVSITDNYTSTDGHAHAIDLLYQNDQALTNGTPAPSQIGYQFPGQTTYAALPKGQTFTPPAGPGTILVKNLLADDGDPFTGQGAITYDTAPTQILSITPNATSTSDFTMHYAASVPATGNLTYHFVYSTDYTTALVKGEALPAMDAFATPTVKITSPTSGTTTHSPTATITGTATDIVAVNSLTVAGHSVPLGAGGAFSTTVPLTKGTNKITAAATNIAGNPASTTVTITYTPLVVAVCKVPKVAGKTLSSAKSALNKAHCTVGKVTRKHSKKIKSGNVISTKPGTGTTHKSGTKINLTISRGK